MVRWTPHRRLGGPLLQTLLSSVAGRGPSFHGAACERPPGFKGFEIWFLWLKRFPRCAFEAIFWGVGGG